MSGFLNLKETEAHIASTQEQMDVESPGEKYPPLTGSERRRIRQGMLTTRTVDMGTNYATYSPNLPNIGATGSTAAESLQHFYNSAPIAEGNTRRISRGPHNSSRPR